MSSNISVPSNFVSLAPAPAAGTRAPLNPAFVPAQKKKPMAILADSDFPEARWNIGGVFLYDNAQSVLCDFAQSNFERNPAIAEIHGAPPCAWTLEWYQFRPLISPGKIAARLKTLAAKPAAFTLYLDNPRISPEMLDDPVGNALLGYAAQMPRAAVSVASEILAEHVRRKFPALKICAGQNKVVAENGRGNAEYYLDAARRFACVAIHSDDAFNLPLLKKLAENADASKFEITLNDTCLRGCPLRERHLDALAEIRKNPWNAAPLRERHRLLAEAKCEEVSVSSAPDAPRAALLSREDAKAAYALGFRRFRVQAETLRSEAAFFWSALRWIFSAKPEHFHYFGLIASSLVTKIKEPVPVLTSGLNPLVKRKYD